MLTIETNLTQREEADLIVVACFQQGSGEPVTEATEEVADLREQLRDLFDAQDFKGKVGESLLAYRPKGSKEKRLLLLGLGKEQDCDLEMIRRAYGALMRRVRGERSWNRINLLLPILSSFHRASVGRCVAEALVSSLYLFEDWKREKNLFHVDRLTLIGEMEQAALDKVVSIGFGVDFARDLIHQNADHITPQRLAEQAKELGHLSGVEVRIHDKKMIEQEGMGLLLAVSSGSNYDPSLIEVVYKGGGRDERSTLIVGKGVTFDTGGLNLKPTSYIEDQRVDMSGGAIALGVVAAAAKMGLTANIVALIPATENAIGPGSYKPGDVIRSSSGKTVEVTNTDAEGRLILADALTYGQKKHNPSWIIDFATLTGAMLVALGELRGGMFTPQDQLADLLSEAGERTGERVWRMPLDRDYFDLLKSDVADLKNCSLKRQAGSITAALFLKQFIDKGRHWVHLDIAGTAFTDKAAHHNLTRASGFGVRLIIEALERTVDAPALLARV